MLQTAVWGRYGRYLCSFLPMFYIPLIHSTINSFFILKSHETLLHILLSLNYFLAQNYFHKLHFEVCVCLYIYFWYQLLWWRIWENTLSNYWTILFYILKPIGIVSSGSQSGVPRPTASQKLEMVSENVKSWSSISLNESETLGWGPVTCFWL